VATCDLDLATKISIRAGLALRGSHTAPGPQAWPPLGSYATSENLPRHPGLHLHPAPSAAQAESPMHSAQEPLFRWNHMSEQAAMVFIEGSRPTLQARETLMRHTTHGERNWNCDTRRTQLELQLLRGQQPGGAPPAYGTSLAARRLTPRRRRTNSRARAD
jgi:hypothetical protein